MTCEEQYKLQLKTVCETLRLDYFPQVRAMDLMYKSLKLKDVYLSLGLTDNRLDYCENDKCVRMAVLGGAGSGKTTYLKWLVLSILEKDEKYLQQLADDYDIRFAVDCFPVFVSLEDWHFLADALEEKEALFSILYDFACQFLGDGAAEEIKEDDFVSLLKEKAQAGQLLLILDGWNKLSDEKLAVKLDCMVREAIQSYADVSLIISARETDQIPTELSESLEANIFYVSELSDQDITAFCKQWFRSVYQLSEASDEEKSEPAASTAKDSEEKNEPKALSPSAKATLQQILDEGFEIFHEPVKKEIPIWQAVAENIINSAKVYDYINEMARNPFSLSLLITLARYDGRLPENKAKLLENIFNLYVGWATNGNGVFLTSKSMTLLLGYIAVCFTEQNKESCTKEELKEIIRGCFRDLSGSFPQKLDESNLDLVLLELEQSAVLGKDKDDRYFFQIHRDMKQFLTATAISSQCATSEYNDMMPIRVFRSKYHDKGWRDIILYATLLWDGRLKKNILEDMLDYLDVEDEMEWALYMLLDMVGAGVELPGETRNFIYDRLCAGGFNLKKAGFIYNVIIQDNALSEELARHIGFQYSVQFIQYAGAKAAVEIAAAVKAGISPLQIAEECLAGRSEVNYYLGFAILSVCAGNSHSHYMKEVDEANRGYRFSQETIANMAEILKQRFFSRKDGFMRSYLVAMVCMGLGAEYFTYEQIVDNELQEKLLKGVKTDSKECINLLCYMPLYTDSYELTYKVPKSIKESYVCMLQQNMEEQKWEKALYNLCLCSAIGALKDDEKEVYCRTLLNSDLVDITNMSGYYQWFRYRLLFKEVTGMR